MIYWFTIGMDKPANFEIGVRAGVWGVPEDAAHRIQPVKSGDQILFYGGNLGFALCEVESEPYEDRSPVWDDGWLDIRRAAQ